MRRLILLFALLVPGLAAANDLPKKAQPGYAQPKYVQPKPKAPPATANPCAQYGTGFVQLPGTQTCVRATGSVQTDVTTSGRAR